METRGVCAERLAFLAEWNRRLSEEVRVALQLDDVTEKTLDFGCHKSLLQEARLLGDKAEEAHRAYVAHVLEHGCDRASGQPTQE
jgi:hypothetical protein